MLPPRDADLVQIVDAAFADAARRAGAHLKCGPGCTQCCVGVFAISALDRDRLRAGLAALEHSDPPRASAVRGRVQASLTRLLGMGFPGDVESGLLADDDLSRESFEGFANDEPCPVLDPDTGRCDLYAHRPMTCRTFGPPVPVDGGGIGLCELCFTEATPAEIDACRMQLPSLEIEAALEQNCAGRGDTLIAFALRAQ